MRRSDSAWKQIGRLDPYFGVVSHDRFRAGAEREEFFRTGERHIERILSAAGELVPGFTPRRAVDFGCGVGRLLIPLARRVPDVTGIDVSPAMIEEARQNCGRAGLRNVSFFSDPSELKGEFDFVHSYIVFQHIPVTRGLKLAAELLQHLAEGGVGALHFTYAYTGPTWRRSVHAMRKWTPGATLLSNLLRGRSPRYPHVDMNPYPLRHLFGLLQANGCHRLAVHFTDHGHHLGAMLVFQRMQNTSCL